MKRCVHWSGNWTVQSDRQRAVRDRVVVRRELKGTERQTESGQGQSGGQGRAERYRATDREQSGTEWWSGQSCKVQSDRQRAVRDRVVTRRELKGTER